MSRSVQAPELVSTIAVLVDDTGRRARRLAQVTWLVALLCVVYVVAVAIGTNAPMLQLLHAPEAWIVEQPPETFPLGWR